MIISLYKTVKTWYNRYIIVEYFKKQSFLNTFQKKIRENMQKSSHNSRPGPVFRFLKRTSDLLLGIIMLILLSPIFLIISIVILITDGRPIVFTQRRVGLNGKPFKCYKFRTMTVEAPHYVGKNEISNPEQYITPFGRFLRATSLDELPQFINIVAGDMSLIGPRPIIQEETNLQNLRREAGVYAVRPGLTGYAQVKGRNDLDDETKVKYDAYYVEHISVWMDIKIIFLTFAVVLFRKGEHEGAAMSLNDPDSSLLTVRQEKPSEQDDQDPLK